MQYDNRVKFWNSLLVEARKYLVHLNDEHNCTCIEGIEVEGETLVDEKHKSLLAISLLVLALEARTSHLAHVLMESGKINMVEREEIKSRNIKQRWKKIAQKSGKTIDFNAWPHDSIKELFKLRNDIFHANFQYTTLISKLPSKTDCVLLYNNIIEAEEDMNVIMEIITEKRVDVIKKLQV